MKEKILKNQQKFSNSGKPERLFLWDFYTMLHLYLRVFIYSFHTEVPMGTGSYREFKG